MMAIGDKGVVTVSAPYDNYLSGVAIYELVEIRDIQLMASVGIDVLAEVYVAVGLDEAMYDEHVKNSVPIYTFMNSGGTLVYVPKTHVLKTINDSVYQYAERTIGINLGILPKEYSLDSVKASLVSLVTSLLGKEPTIKDVASSVDIGLSDVENNEALSRIRNTNALTCEHQLSVANTTITELKCSITALQCKIYNLENPQQ